MKTLKKTLAWRQRSVATASLHMALASAKRKSGAAKALAAMAA